MNLDKYDRAIAHLTKHPDQISSTWVSPDEYEAGCLFEFLSPDYRSGKDWGCPTLVKHGGFIALTDEITEAIRNDPRIPGDHSKITIESLEAFAEYQRMADAAGRVLEGGQDNVS